MGKHWKHIKTKEHQAKITAALKGRKNSKPMPISMRRKTSLRMKTKNPSKRKEVRELLRIRMLGNSIANGRSWKCSDSSNMSGDRNQTYSNNKLEHRIAIALKEAKFEYLQNKRIQKIAIVDFYLPNFSIIIQCDGCYWHGCEKCCPDRNTNRHKIDVEQDKKLKLAGFRVFRFWEHEITTDIQKCINKIQRYASTK